MLDKIGEAIDMLKKSEEEKLSIQVLSINPLPFLSRLLVFKMIKLFIQYPNNLLTFHTCRLVFKVLKGKLYVQVFLKSTLI